MRFVDDEFQFGLEVALGASYRQGADVGEVLAAAARIIDGDADSWLHEWTTLAGLVWSAALIAEQTGRPVSALAHYRRAPSPETTPVPIVRGRRHDLVSRRWSPLSAAELGRCVPGTRRVLDVHAVDAPVPYSLSSYRDRADNAPQRPCRAGTTCGVLPGTLSGGMRAVQKHG